MEKVLLLVAGGVIAALSAWVAAWINNHGSDNRLKIQHIHENQQREKELIRAVKNEPIETLSAVISVVVTITGELGAANKTMESNDEMFARMLSTMGRATVLMRAIGEFDVARDIDSLKYIFNEFLKEDDVSELTKLVLEKNQETGELLRSIAEHRARLMTAAAKIYAYSLQGRCNITQPPSASGAESPGAWAAAEG